MGFAQKNVFSSIYICLVNHILSKNILNNLDERLNSSKIFAKVVLILIKVLVRKKLRDKVFKN